MSPKFNGKCSYKTLERGKDGHRGEGGRKWGRDRAMPPPAKDAWSHQELERRGRNLLQDLQRELGPADTSISDFWPLEL